MIRILKEKNGFIIAWIITFFCFCLVIISFVSSKKITFFVFAIVACAVAIPAGVPQPRPIAPVAHQRQAANPESEQLNSSADDQDLKGSSSYGYGYYGGGLGGYGGYGGAGGLGTIFLFKVIFFLNTHAIYSGKFHFI